MSDRADIAIEAKNICKRFKIPHEKHETLKAAALNIFNRKSYSEFDALKDVSFSVNNGEFFGIIGQNGSGKSTLLKILAGIYLPSAGEVKINGKLSPFLELGVGFNPELTARENVFLGGAVLGLSRKELERNFEHIINFAELEEFVDMKFKNFSSGMQVRLAFALSIHAHAEILLMDEVLAVGDSNFQAKCIKEFIRYKEEGKTIVLVTHDMYTVIKYCDRVLFLNNGIKKAIGEPRKTVYEYELAAAKEAYSRERQVDSTEQRIGRESGNRWGSQDVSVDEVEIIDESNNRKNIFKSYEGMAIRIHYTNKKKIERAIFGIEIFNEESYRLFGIHSGMVNKKINLNERGFVDFVVDSLPLSDGRYYINPAIANEIGNLQYDYRKSFKAFTVVNSGFDKSFLGDVNMKIKINE